MITNKDIRVENGFLIINGDKFPLDGQSPETIMDIVEDNSDTTPTENSTAPITSGGVYTALGTKQDTLTFDTTPTENSTNPVESGGVYAKIGDLTRTGITGSSVAAQLTSVAGQLGDLHIAVFEHEFTDVDITNAWGSMYESTDTLSFDISTLGLQNAPKFAIVGIKSTGAAVILTAPTNTATAINFRAVRPSTSTDLTIVATALVIY